jgi:hypothetical protein
MSTPDRLPAPENFRYAACLQIDTDVHLICIAGRERQEADMIATPTWMLEGRTFAPATSAARHRG